MTGGAFTARAEAFFRSTTPRFIEKPFEVDELMKVIDGVISA